MARVNHPVPDGFHLFYVEMHCQLYASVHHEIAVTSYSYSTGSDFLQPKNTNTINLLN